MTTKAPEGARAAAAAPGAWPVASGACWCVVHEMRDTSAAWLATELAVFAAPLAVAVLAVPVVALLGRVRWQLRVETQGSACTLRAPSFALHAGLVGDGNGASLAGVVNRCGPVLLPPSVDDADYKSAEWSALLVAWLNGLPCPVVNRPSARQLNPAQTSAARWRQAAAVAELPIWPLPPAGAAPAGVPAASPGLLVVGSRCFEPVEGSAGAATGPGWPAAARRAAAEAAARQGCDLLAWTGARDTNDAHGTWRISGATPWPDLRPFGLPAVRALAEVLAGAPAAAATSAHAA